MSHITKNMHLMNSFLPNFTGTKLTYPHCDFIQVQFALSFIAPGKLNQ